MQKHIHQSVKKLAEHLYGVSQDKQASSELVHLFLISFQNNKTSFTVQF
jgi:hypothetical protein